MVIDREYFYKGGEGTMSETLVLILILCISIVLIRVSLFIVFCFVFKWSVSKSLKTSVILTMLPKFGFKFKD